MTETLIFQFQDCHHLNVNRWKFFNSCGIKSFSFLFAHKFHIHANLVCIRARLNERHQVFQASKPLQKTKGSEVEIRKSGKIIKKTGDDICSLPLTSRLGQLKDKRKLLSGHAFLLCRTMKSTSFGNLKFWGFSCSYTICHIEYHPRRASRRCSFLTSWDARERLGRGNDVKLSINTAPHVTDDTTT